MRDRRGIAGISALHITPPQAGRATLLYFHGGGYVFGSPDTHSAMLAVLARTTGLRAVLPRYRLAPENPFPAAIEDALAVYRALAAHGPVIVGGDSAGGGLGLALLGEILRQEMPKPMGVFAFSPLTDVAFHGESVAKNAQEDVVLPADRVQEMAAMVLKGQSPDDPRISPLFADFTGAPPVWLTVGDTEILLNDTTRIADRMQQQGVPVTRSIAHDLPHVWPLFHNYLPEARTTLREVCAWITSLSRSSTDS